MIKTIIAGCVMDLVYIQVREGAGPDKGILVVGPRILALASVEAVTLFVF